MPLSSEDYILVEDLADLLYEFLPASGNSTTSFPIAARKAGVGDLWTLEGSKRPAIVDFLSRVLQHRRDRFPSLMLCIVRQSATWRDRKGNPLTRNEVDKLNSLVLKAGYKVTVLHDPEFLSKFAAGPGDKSDPNSLPAEASLLDRETLLSLDTTLLSLSKLAPQERGFAFEKWLKDFFAAHAMSPRGAFRIVGEQIDGSLEYKGQPYLLEAKWKNSPVGLADLLTFAGKVEGKAVWARGLFVSYSGFTTDGLEAFGRGRRTNLVAIDGRDLSYVLKNQVPFSEVLDLKLHAASSTNRAYVPIEQLWPAR